MNILGLVVIIAGIMFLTYSIISKNKINIYNRRDNLSIKNERKFLKLQLYFSVLNSVYLITYGLVILIYDLDNLYIVLSPLIFHFINYLIRLIGKSQGYIELK